jgi:hypothetical protein
MFLVEPKSGQRWHYESARALGAAIRRGELSPQARIFHQAANQWLPITVHPEYTKAKRDREEGSAHTWQQRQWTFLAERPDASPDAMFTPIPAQTASTLVPIPGRPEPSWLGLAFQRLLQLARCGI